MGNSSTKVIQSILIVVVAVALAAAIGSTEWGRSAENFYDDYGLVFAGIRYKPQHTALVSIDDETLLALKEDPLAFWAPYLGRVMEVLDGVPAKVVGLDLLYQVSAEEWLRKLDIRDSEASRTYDSPLRAALATGNKVLIAHLVGMKNGQTTLLLPPEDQRLLLPGGLADVGIANLDADEDKHVRKFNFVYALSTEPRNSFGWQLAIHAGASPELGGFETGPRIGFAGPPGTIPAISMNELLRPDALSNAAVRALKDKVVIIGSRSAALPDRHFTPYSRIGRNEQMAGAEIHANIVETILSGRYLRQLPLPAEIVYMFFVAGLGVYGFFKLNPAFGGLFLLVSCGAVLLPGYVLLSRDVILPVAQPQIALVGGFLMTLSLRLGGEERERLRLRRIFGRYVSDEVVEKLLSQDRRPDLGGEVLAVTVLFSDIRNFTTISEKLSAHEVVEMLNAYFTVACEPILEQGGTVDKYIGDAVMAVFGSPVRYSDHAQRAVFAAIGMARAADGFKQWMQRRFRDRGLPDFAIGIGLHTGDALIGDIGTPKRKEFTAIGDTVNTASRLESATKELGWTIVASESTVNAAGQIARTSEPRTIAVKGRCGPIRVFEVIAPKEY